MKIFLYNIFVAVFGAYICWSNCRPFLFFMLVVFLTVFFWHIKFIKLLFWVSFFNQYNKLSYPWIRQTVTYIYTGSPLIIKHILIVLKALLVWPGYILAIHIKAFLLLIIKHILIVLKALLVWPVYILATHSKAFLLFITKHILIVLVFLHKFFFLALWLIFAIDFLGLLEDLLYFNFHATLLWALIGIYLFFSNYYCLFKKRPLFLFLFLIYIFFFLRILALFFYFISPYLLESILTIVFLLMSVAAYSLLDRKIIALIQRRKGPNVVGVYGLLQFLFDAIKLFFKEILVPSRASGRLFLFAPLLTLSLSLLSWAALPTHPVLSFPHMQLDLLVILAVSSLNVYSVVLSGWSSNSRYSFLGSLRAIAQIISYELPMFFSLMPVVAMTSSLSLKTIILYQSCGFFLIPFFPAAIIFLISIIAETSRAPFDLPEAESELVAGYNTEYSSLIFAFFFIGEYTNMLLMSAVWVSIFWGGWLPFLNFLDFIPANINFSIKLCFLSFFLVFVRANLPRYRYDQFMCFGWKILLPISFSFFLVSLTLIFFFF